MITDNDHFSDKYLKVEVEISSETDERINELILDEKYENRNTFVLTAINQLLYQELDLENMLDLDYK